jgi:phosphopantothenoylcysteine decarboxylase/phosphopantothenate--cysteine ligase
LGGTKFLGRAAIEAALARGDADLVLMAAAVADYRPADAEAGKRPKDGKEWTVRLEPTTDVLRELGGRRTNGQILVGFAAETGEHGLERAREKLRAKQVDLIVFNDVSDSEIGFESERNAVTLITAAGETEVPIDSKDAIAEAILGKVDHLREKSGRPAA